MTQEKADPRNQHRGAQQHGEHCPDRLLDAVHPGSAHILGDENLSRLGKAHGGERQQMQDIAADGNGGHSRSPDVLAHDNHIHNVVAACKAFETKKGNAKRSNRPATFPSVRLVAIDWLI